jgi:hypothetical protein
MSENVFDSLLAAGWNVVIWKKLVTLKKWNCSAELPKKNGLEVGALGFKTLNGLLQCTYCGLLLVLQI